MYLQENKPWMNLLARDYMLIKSELESFLSQHKGDLTTAYKDYVNNNGWKTIPLIFFTLNNPLFTSYFPTTLKLVNQIPNLISVEFSILQPNTMIKPHEGYSKEVMRSHLGLKVPKGDIYLKTGEHKYSWREGDFLSFNDGYMHEAWNRTDTDRWVLMIDTPVADSAYSAYEIAKYKIEHLEDPVLLSMAPKSVWLDVFNKQHNS